MKRHSQRFKSFGGKLNHDDLKTLKQNVPSDVFKTIKNKQENRHVPRSKLQRVKRWFQTHPKITAALGTVATIGLGAYIYKKTRRNTVRNGKIQTQNGRETKKKKEKDEREAKEKKDNAEREAKEKKEKAEREAKEKKEKAEREKAEAKAKAEREKAEKEKNRARVIEEIKTKAKEQKLIKECKQITKQFEKENKEQFAKNNKATCGEEAFKEKMDKIRDGLKKNIKNRGKKQLDTLCCDKGSTVQNQLEQYAQTCRNKKGLEQLNIKFEQQQQEEPRNIYNGPFPSMYDTMPTPLKPPSDYVYPSRQSSLLHTQRKTHKQRNKKKERAKNRRPNRGTGKKKPNEDDNGSLIASSLPTLIANVLGKTQ